MSKAKSQLGMNQATPTDGGPGVDSYLENIEGRLNRHMELLHYRIDELNSFYDRLFSDGGKQVQPEQPTPTSPGRFPALDQLLNRIDAATVQLEELTGRLYLIG